MSAIFEESVRPPWFLPQRLYNRQPPLHIPALMWLSIAIPILLSILVIVCILLTLVVLMQRPKNEGLGAAFGSGMTENIFGAQTATVLTKATVYLGCIFFGITLLLTVLTARQSLDRRIGVLESEVRKTAALPKQKATMSATTAAAGSPHATASMAASATPIATPSPEPSTPPAPSPSSSPGTASNSSPAPALSPKPPSPLPSASPQH
ncbi:MAG: preprotein translocase subunit SecG [Verrucomicrobia bacterium]|nr:preprotein translocase subunit SecG [Verrucomicrobiota bacterium]